MTRMVPSAPVFLWKASISRSGKSQMTSLQQQQQDTGPWSQALSHDIAEAAACTGRGEVLLS